MHEEHQASAPRSDDQPGYGAARAQVIDKTPLNFLSLGLIRLALPDALDRLIDLSAIGIALCALAVWLPARSLDRRAAQASAVSSARHEALPQCGGGE